MAESIACSLVQNAMDYLLLAGEQAETDTPRMLKHAVATLADGLELLLKSRLEIGDWKLLFADEAEASPEKYEQGSFRSVTVDEAVRRLRERCSVNLPSRHKKLLGRLRDMRNRIRHFAVATTRAAALSLIVRSYSFAIDFVADQIEPHRQADVGRELDLLRTLLGKYDKFVTGRLEEIKPILEGPTYCPLVECMACLQRTLLVDGGTAQCSFCGYRRDGEVAAEKWVERHFGTREPKERLAHPVREECAECGASACVPMGQVRGDAIQYVCLSCGEHGDLERCDGCGRLYTAAFHVPGVEEVEWSPFCYSCRQEAMERD